MSPGVQVGVLVVIAVALISAAVWIILRVHGTPEKREKKRRLEIHHRGRLGDALITEANDTTLYYSYSVRGVQYTASQDVTALRDRLPADPERLIGSVSLKYATNNPANSILLCEEWSGLRAAAQSRERE